MSGGGGVYSGVQMSEIMQQC